MPFPAPLALLFMSGAAYLLLGQKKSPASGAGQLPAQPATGAGTTITIPPNVLTDHPDVPPTNAPSVTVQVPSYTTNPSQVPAGGYATGDKSDQLPAATQTPQQVVTQQLPNLVNQAAQAVQTATGSVARFPDLPGAIPTLPPVVIPTVPLPPGALPGPTPLQHEETQPAQDPHGTIALAKDMINAESSNGWKSAMQDRIKAWQAIVGLAGPDGKFGPNSAYQMALEVGVLPLIRYWPKATQLNNDLKAYRDRLLTMGANADNHNPAMAAALRSSAAYETGVAYTGTPKAIDPSARAAQAVALKNAIGA